VLSDSAGAQQPYIGRGESLLALHHMLTGIAAGPSRVHLEDCLRLVDCLSSDSQPNELERSFSAFCRHLEAQGCAPQSWLDRVLQTAEADRLELVAQAGGPFALDMASLRTVLVDANTTVPRVGTTFADEVGVVLMAMPGAIVSEGQPLLAIRCTGDMSTVAERIAACISIAPEADRTLAKAAWHGRQIRAASR
jgi:hypothetical protein